MNKMLRKALLGGAALAVMTTGAAADELSTLKAQLADLQSQVNQLQSAPAALPTGKSLMTFERGQGTNTWGVQPAREIQSLNKDENGFTIGITPTADLPAPVAEITVYGYVAAHLSYDFDAPDDGFGLTNSFSASSITPNFVGEDHISLTANQSRFGIKSKIDTAIGQIRTQIEGDFMGDFDRGNTLGHLRLRHAVGHWDMTPNWTFTAGQYWMTAALLPIGVSTVDFAGSLLTYSRRPQIRLQYNDGPLSWAVAIEEPELETTTNMPNIASFIQYDIAGGHQFIVTGEIADWAGADQLDAAGNVVIAAQDELAWAVQVGANFNLADVASLTAGFGYGEGLLADKFNFEEGFRTIDVNGDPLESLAFVVGLSFGLSETTTFNAQFSYAEAIGDQTAAGPTAGEEEKVYKVHANILWQPVKQMRMGWEVLWANKEFEDGVERDGVRAGFVTFFFF